MRAAIYARFSSDNQNPRSCADQIAHVTPWIVNQGWDVVAVYQDDAISGREIAGRVQWQRLLKDAEASPRPFDVVVMEALDRWGREFFSQLDGAGRLHRAGVALADVAGGTIDLGSLVGQIRFSIEAASSANVSQRISEHTKRGLEQRIGHVSAPGGTTPLGYTRREYLTGARDSRGRQVREKVVYEIDEETAPIIRRIFGLRTVDGLGFKGIARTLTEAGVPSPRGGTSWPSSTIRAILTNPVYAGHTRRKRWQAIRDPYTGEKKMRKAGDGSGELIRDTHPAIVDQDTWDAANEGVIDVYRGGSAKRKRPLSGLLVCGTCGGPMSIRDKRGYGCKDNLRGGPCTNQIRLKANRVEASVRSWLASHDAENAIREILDLADAHEDQLAANLALAEKAAATARQRHQNMVAILAKEGPEETLLEQYRATKRAKALAEAKLKEARTAVERRPSAEAVADALRARELDEWMRPGNLAEIVSEAIVEPDGTVSLLTTFGQMEALVGEGRRARIGRLSPGLEPGKGDRHTGGIAPTGHAPCMTLEIGRLAG